MLCDPSEIIVINIYNIGFQRYRDEKLRVCDKDSIPSQIFNSSF